jgi:hypothetical protein
MSASNNLKSSVRLCLGSGDSLALVLDFFRTSLTTIWIYFRFSRFFLPGKQANGCDSLKSSVPLFFGSGDSLALVLDFFRTSLGLYSSIFVIFTLFFGLGSKPMGLMT